MATVFWPGDERVEHRVVEFEEADAHSMDGAVKRSLGDLARLEGNAFFPELARQVQRLGDTVG